jgi:NAD(P)H dehydrogenase (quinone)
LKVSVILAHPDPSSFNHALAGTVQSLLLEYGHRVNFHDLYKEGFEPVLPTYELPGKAPPLPIFPNASLALHQDEIKTADGIVIIHPNWWGQPPAILKGWLDRILQHGIAYRFLEGDSGEGIPEALLPLKHAVVLNTSNTPPEREARDFGDPLELIWRNCIFSLCSRAEFQRRQFSAVVTSTFDERLWWLDETEDIVTRCFPPVSSAD